VDATICAIRFAYHLGKLVVACLIGGLNCPLVNVRETHNPSDDVIDCTTCHYVKASILLIFGAAAIALFQKVLNGPVQLMMRKRFG
jgi:hypothetical protein